MTLVTLVIVLGGLATLVGVVVFTITSQGRGW